MKEESAKKLGLLLYNGVSEELQITGDPLEGLLINLCHIVTAI